MAVGSMSAQPTAVKNAAKGVFSLTTFRADGSLLDTSHGIFVSETGEAVSNLKPSSVPPVLWWSTRKVVSWK